MIRRRIIARATKVRFIAAALLTTVVTLASSCGSSSSDPTTPEGREAAIEAANYYLSKNDCTSAIALLDPIYRSANSDNTIRLMMASAYACKGNVNFFKLIGQLAENSPALAGNGFWALMAKLFPASATDPNDKAVEASILASDALLSALKPGAVILPTTYIDPKGFNPGAKVASDRVDDANSYLLFVSMAAIGSMLNKYGAPDPVLHIKTGAGLPWEGVGDVNMATDGCAFASEVLHFVDTVGAVANTATGGLKTALTSLKTAVAMGMDAACDIGCKLCDPTFVCTPCPIDLRDRNACTGVATDRVSCAATGIIRAVNASWVVPVP